MKCKKLWTGLLAGFMTLTMLVTGCGQVLDGDGMEREVTADLEDMQVAAEESEAQTDLTQKPDTDNYLEVALNVYYNDGDKGYYSNEAGSSIYITEEGQYTVTFDCANDLSTEATDLGINSLTNLTAIYLLDMGASNGAQSPLKACNIMYDAVVVDDTELTVTQTEPKSAFKSSGIFDTNDPINAWDGSSVEEVVSTSDHVANFTSVTDPTKVSVTFTLSGLDWVGQSTGSDTVASANDYVNSMVYSNLEFADMSALEVSKLMGNGINLGNTMEAYGRATLGTGATVSSYETYWGQPVTTPEMIQGMKNCGFDTIRIPVAWTNMMDYESGDYTIDSAYLDRIEELVTYALDAEMFVIINDHWDGGWWGMFGSASEETRNEAMTIYTEMWKQIAERFADYSGMVIFESANEELGQSLNSNTLCSDSGSLTEDELYETTNLINQTFVDLVRSTGGNNEARFLLIAGYNTDIDHTVDDRFVMPKDSAKDKLLVSVHYYTPWNYCGAEKQAKWGIQSDYALMDEMLGKMTKFTDAGYGVILGEYAALPVYHEDTKSSEMKENTVEFTCHFLDNCDKYNFVPLLWDRSDLYQKDKFTMMDDSLTLLYTSRCYQEESSQDSAERAALLEEHMMDMEAQAPEMWEGVETYEPGTPVAWIMWNGGAGTYSVGDVYNPSDNTEGITAHDVIVDGAGEYTVSLDFAGGNDGLTFAALAIADCELLYPGAIIDIKEILLNGEPAKLAGLPYTSSDDSICTRVNLCNTWVSEIPDDARNRQNNLNMATPVILKSTDVVGINNITINFELIVPEEE